MQVAPFLHWPTQSSKSLAHVGPPQPSRQTHENEPGLLLHWRAFTQGPIVVFAAAAAAVAAAKVDDAAFKAAINAEDEVLEPATAAATAAVEVRNVEVSGPTC